MKQIILYSLVFSIVACSAPPAQESQIETTPADTSRVYYPNGQLQMEGLLVNGLREGKWRAWYQNGFPWSETTFSKGIKNGPTTTWYENGHTRYEGMYRDGENAGRWVHYDSTGMKQQEIHYDK